MSASGYPFGLRVRGAIVAAATRIQGLPGYRAVARRLVGPVQVREPTAAEAALIRSRWPGTGHPRDGEHVRVTMVVAVGRGRPLGWHYLQRRDETCVMPGYVVSGVYTRLTARRLGVASRLLASSLRRAEEEGAEQVLLWVDSHNHAALRTYDSLGFAVTDDDGLDELLRARRERYGIEQVVMARRTERPRAAAGQGGGRKVARP